MKIDERERVLADAINIHGEEYQISKVEEECAELIVALKHFKLKRLPEYVVAEEVADVLIMCSQLAKILGEDLVFDAVDQKLNRLYQRTMNEIKD
jgi:NTP pyrophosphatase (non-canonical NTP hydrolase)